MRNIVLETSNNGEKLTITVDLRAHGTPSRTGKTFVLATTEGNVALETDPKVFVGVNVYRKP